MYSEFFVQVPKLQQEIQQYIESADYQNRAILTDFENIFANPKMDNQTSTEYNPRLLEIQKEIQTLKKETFGERTRIAITNIQNNPKLEFVIPTSKLDPLLIAYEEKIFGLEFQVILKVENYVKRFA